MSKKERRQRKRRSKAISETQTPRRKPITPPSGNITKLGGLGWKSVVAVGTILSLIPLYFYLNAISISASQFSTDPADPLTHVFTVKNTFIIPVYNVYPECVINLTVQGKPRLQNFVVSEIDPIERLGLLDNFDTQCPLADVVRADIRDLAPIDLDICVRGLYTPLGFPIERDKFFRFIMIKNSQQQVYWSQQPADTCEERFAPIIKRLEAAKKLRSNTK